MDTRRFSQPPTVKFVNCMLLAYAAFVIWLVLHVFKTHAPDRSDPLFLGSAAALTIVAAACGAFMFTGANWARILFFGGFLPVNLVFIFTRSGPLFAIGLIIPFFLGLFLIPRDANRFFTGRNTLFKPRPADPEQLKKLRREFEDGRSGRFNY